jgi:preprotein translocase subunit SecE
MSKIVEFVDQVGKESKKITWSSRKETTTSMMMVIGMVIIASIFFFLIDMGVYKLVQILLNLGVN